MIRQGVTLTFGRKSLMSEYSEDIKLLSLNADGHRVTDNQIRKKCSLPAEFSLTELAAGNPVRHGNNRSMRYRLKHLATEGLGELWALISHRKDHASWDQRSQILGRRLLHGRVAHTVVVLQLKDSNSYQGLRRSPPAPNCATGKIVVGW